MTHLNGSRKVVTSECRTEDGEKKRHSEGQLSLKKGKCSTTLWGKTARETEILTEIRQVEPG